MTKRKERTVKELYNATDVITAPEITPVLRGSCRMHGPVDEEDFNVLSDTVSSRVGKRSSRHSKSQKDQVRTESGTCNVCSAHCSSCLHDNQALMGSKTVVDETIRENTHSSSVNDVVPNVLSRTCKTGEQTVSETSILVSKSSSYDSFAENAKSQASLRTSDVFGGSEDSANALKLSCGRTFREDQNTSKPLWDAEKRYLTDKFEVPGGLEGHDDNISCVTRADAANKSNGSDFAFAYKSGIEVYGKAASECLDVKCSIEQSQNNPSRQSRSNAEPMQKVSPCISLSTELPSRNSSLMENPSSRDTHDATGSGNAQSSFSHFPGGKSFSCDRSLRSSEEDSCSPLGELPDCSKENSYPSMTKVVGSDIISGSKSASYNSDDIQDNKVGLVGDDLEDSVRICQTSVAENQTVEKVEELVLSDSKQASFQSRPVDESDESDIVEHDVKVCDICGDAGREDLLAICCKCTDGAEHTYCMGEMLDIVPKGDWLCEECRAEEEIKIQKHDVIAAVDTGEKNQSSGQADARGSDVDGSRSNKGFPSAKVSGKRHAEDPEVSSATKKQALEPIMGSPKISSPNRLAALSRDSSFKNLDRGKVKPAHQYPPINQSSNDSPEITWSPTAGPRLQTTRGAFVKSNSFTSSNAKPKVKLVDEVLPQTPKATRGSGSLDTREGAGRVIGKSMSFKSVTSGRLNAGESKVKMLSPSFSHVRNLKGSKHTKDRNILERKSSFKSERVSANSTIVSSSVSTLKIDQKPASRGETVSLSSTSYSKPTNHVARRSTEMPISLGEVKRQLSPSVVGASYVNGIISSIEQKPIISSLKEDLSSSSFDADRPVCDGNESLPDGLPGPRELTNLGERMKESSVSGPRLMCQRCNEIGHAAQFCTVDTPRSLAIDSSAARSLKEVQGTGTNLKAAIEAAMLKKPGIYRKNKVRDRLDEVPVSSMTSEGSSLSNIRNKIFTEVVNEGEGIPAKSFLTDLPSQASVVTPVLLEMSAIPEHEYVWQGSFEVHRSGKVPDACDGFQAHLSTRASPKVSEAVNKFSCKLLLNEVPRLSTWPLQFEENGVKEDNIAVYFFAKDLESYEKSYKVLLESMMRSDLALKGIIDGVELLIFPSNQLPEKSQRWNMLFFLWGVFRAKRMNCLPQSPSSPKKFYTTRDIPTAIMSLPENICSLGPVDKVASGSRCDVATEALPSTVKCAQRYVEHLDYRQDSRSSSLQSCPEVRGPSIPLKGYVGFSCQQNSDLQASDQVMRTDDGPNRSEKMPICWDSPLDRQQASFHHIMPVPAIAQDVASLRSLCKENVLDRINCSKDQVTFGRNLEVEGSLDAKASLQKDTIMGVPTTEELNSCHVNSRKRPFVDPTKTISQVASAVTSQTVTWNGVNILSGDGVSVSKKQKTGSVGLYGCNVGTSSSTDSFASAVDDAAIVSPVKVKQFEEPCDGKSILENSGNPPERYFFPVEPHPVKVIGLGDQSLPGMGFSLDNADRLRDRVPNLELALGAARKSSKQGTPPFFVGKVDESSSENQPLHKASDKLAEDDASASLSLSLSFPFPDKDRAVESVKKAEQLLTGRQHVKSSLLLFGGFSDK